MIVKLDVRLILARLFRPILDEVWEVKIVYVCVIVASNAWAFRTGGKVVFLLVRSPEGLDAPDYMTALLKRAENNKDP
jgi:hypothetical protein